MLSSFIPQNALSGEIENISWQKGEGGEIYFEYALPEEFLKPEIRFVPSLSLILDNEFSYDFTLFGKVDEQRTIKSSLAWIGSDSGRQLEKRKSCSDCISSEIDLFILKKTLASATLRCRVDGLKYSECNSVPALFTLSVSSVDKEEKTSLEKFDSLKIALPAFSQMEEQDAIKEKICSPTSIAMVLNGYGRELSPGEAASLAYHEGSKLYGVWPQALYAAHRSKVAGYLFEFSSWQQVIDILNHGIPIIASIRYEDGELTGAAINKTAGHLIVIRGIKDDKVYVHDPAAASNADVSRSYDLKELTNVWLNRLGLGYILIPWERLGFEQ